MRMGAYMRQIDRVKEDRVKVVYVFLYKVIFELAYISVVSPIYSYMELSFTPNYTKLLISTLTTVVCICFLPKDTEKASTYLIDTFFVFTIIPILGIYWMKNQSTTYMLMCVCSLGVLILITKFASNRPWRIVFRRTIDPCILLLLLIVLGVLVLTINYGVASLTALNMEDVYEVRGSRNYSGFNAYIVNWVPKAFIPCLLVFSLYKKKYFFVLTSISLQVYMYLFTGAKTTLFSIVLIVFTFLLMKKNVSKYIEKWSQFLIVCVSGAIFFVLKWNSVMLLSIVCMRLSSVPANISFKHYNFFVENPKLYFAENFIGRLFGINSPYDEFSTMMLGGDGGNANTGYLGDAYANGGFLIMIVYSVLLGVLLRLIDSMEKKYKSVIVACFIYSIIMLNDTSLTVSMITGGMLLIFPFLWLFISSENKTRKE